MKTEQARNGLYPVANGDSMRLARRARVQTVRLCVKYSALLCVCVCVCVLAKPLQHRWWQELRLKKECVETCKI
jgi:hypothetical protein